jgi:gamma-glutamylcyclotransferase (GGCT)/AIG2-like uncharacterized protein YtfP
MSEYLFVYGTLQAGLAPSAMASVVRRLRLVGQGSVRGVLYDFGHYPGALLDAFSQSKVFGTVYELPEDGDVLHELDEYEEYDPASPAESQYLRVLQPVLLATGMSLDCWVYIYNRSPGDAAIIPTGKWG